MNAYLIVTLVLFAWHLYIAANSQVGELMSPWSLSALRVRRITRLVLVLWALYLLVACGGSDEHACAADTPAPQPPACASSGACT